MNFYDLGQVVLFSLISIVTLFGLTKLMGKRQVSQLTLFDYIAGISIGSIAADMAMHPDPEGWYGLLAMAIYAGFTILLNLVDDKSIRLRRFLLGEPMILYDNGTLYYQNLKKARLDLTEFLTECRASGYFDLSKLHMIILEVNGKLSFLPMESDRPLTPTDMQLSVKQQRPVITVIMDGALQPESLHATGNDENWLRKQLKLQGFHSEKEILLATIDTENNLALYEKNEDAKSKSYYS